MLQSMRVLAQSWIFKGLMLLLVVSFSIWGIGDIFRGNLQQKAVATVGDVKITVGELEQAFKKDLPEARQVFGPQLTENEARQIGILDRTLNGLMQKAANDQEVKKLGLNVSNKSILQFFATQPELQDKQGHFDRAKWRRLVAESRQTEQNIFDMERAFRGRKLLISGLIENTPLPNLMVKDLYRARADKRVLEVLSLRHNAMKVDDKPDEKTLRAYYDKEAAQEFTAPEYRSLTVAILNGDAVMKNIKPSDDEIKNAYDERKDSLKRPEKRDILQVVLQDEAKAKALAEAAQKTGDLASAAKAMKLTAVPIAGVDDKSVMHELYASVFAIAEGQIAPPVKSQLGWHVVQLKKIHPSGLPALAEVKDEIRDSLKNEQASDYLAKAVNQLDDELAAGHSLEDIADLLKLRLIKTPLLTSQGLRADGSKLKEELPKGDVIKTAFSQAASDVSAVIEDGQGNYLVVRTDDVQPSQIRPFDSVKAIVAQKVIAERQTEAARQKAEEIAKALRDGANFSKFATLPGVDVRLSKPLSLLGDADSELPPQVAQRAFTIKNKDIDVVSDENKEFVFRLVRVEPASADKQQEEKLRTQLTRSLSMDLLELYANYLKSAYPVRLDTTLLDSLKKKESD